MKNKLKFSHGRSRNRGGGGGGGAVTVATEEEVKWEMRPGGMLVQKRSENSEVSSGIVPPNLIKVRVAHGVLRYEISVNPQTTFGKCLLIILDLPFLFYIFQCLVNTVRNTTKPILVQMIENLFIGELNN